MKTAKKNNKIRGLYFGTVEFGGVGGFQERFISELLDSGIRVRAVRFENGTVSGAVSPTDYYACAKAAKKHGVRIKAKKRGGLYFTLTHYSRRIGLYVGLLVFAVILCSRQSRVADISIDGDVSREQIIRILDECGIREGVSTHGLSFSRAERRIMLEVADVSWVDVSNVGYRVSVSVKKAVPKPEMVEPDKPCNIVAERDAVIVNSIVRNGATMLEIGSGVPQGGLIVSGVVIDSEGNIIYKHASADIIGEFTETREFYVPYKETIRTADGEKTEFKYLVFMDDTYPLFWGDAYVEDAVYSEETALVRFFGDTLPFKIKTGTFTRYRSQDITRSKEDCINELNRLKTDFEENFYSDFEIMDCTEEVYPQEDGIRLKLNYVLRGNIARESAIELAETGEPE